MCDNIEQCELKKDNNVTSKIHHITPLLYNDVQSRQSLRSSVVLAPLNVEPYSGACSQRSTSARTVDHFPQRQLSTKRQTLLRVSPDALSVVANDEKDVVVTER